MRKLFKGGNYSRVEIIRGNTVNIENPYFEEVHFIENLKRPACASKRDGLVLGTIRYLEFDPTQDTNSGHFGCKCLVITTVLT